MTKTQANKTSNEHNFRVIVRGTNAKGKRVRHVITTPATDTGAAVLAAEKAAIAKLGKLTKPYISVLPPLVNAQ